MPNEVWLFVLLLIINLIITIIYLLWGCILRKDKEGRKQYIINAVVMLLCPAAGALFLFISTFFFHTIMRREVDLAEDIFFSKERVKVDERANEERERNIVPMVDALAVSDTVNLRSYMLNVLTRDISESLSSIAEALNSDDSETAHYAAAVLSDRLGEFRGKVMEMYKNIKSLHETPDPSPEVSFEKYESIRVLVMYMESVLSQNVFSAMEQESYTKIMDEICDILYSERPDLLTIEFYTNAITRLTRIGDFEKAQLLSERALDEFPNKLQAYTASLHLYFAMENKEEFYKIVDLLKSSSISMDNEARDLIKMFDITV